MDAPVKWLTHSCMCVCVIHLFIVCSMYNERQVWGGGVVQSSATLPVFVTFARQNPRLDVCCHLFPPASGLAVAAAIACVYKCRYYEPGPVLLR